VDNGQSLFYYSGGRLERDGAAAVPSVTITAMPKRGAIVEQSGIYWCSVCKLPVRLNKGDVFPECANMCARGGWEPVQLEETAAESK